MSLRQHILDSLVIYHDNGKPYLRLCPIESPQFRHGISLNIRLADDHQRAREIAADYLVECVESLTTRNEEERQPIVTAPLSEGHMTDRRVNWYHRHTLRGPGLNPRIIISYTDTDYVMDEQTAIELRDELISVLDEIWKVRTGEIPMPLEAVRP